MDKKREDEILEAVNQRIEKFEQDNQNSIESMKKYLEETKNNYSILNDWYKGKFTYFLIIYFSCIIRNKIKICICKQ